MKHLVIGGGSIGKRHLKNLLSINETDIYCLRREANDNFDFEFSCRTLVRNDITDFGEFDAIFICTPSNLHFTNLKDIIENTSKPIHILIEKPFFISTEEFKILKDINGKKIKHFMGFMLRFHPCIAKIKNLIETDFLGPIYHCRLEFGSFLPAWHPNEDYTKSYASQTTMKGGVINTICHELDLLVHFFGLPIQSKSMKTNTKILPIDCEDIAELTFLFNWGIASIHLNYLDKNYHRSIHIKGLNGVLKWDWNDNQIIFQNNHGEKTILFELKNFETNQLYIDELTYFLNLIQDSSIKNPYNFEDSFLFSELLTSLS